MQNKAFAATSQMQAVSNLLQFYGDIQDDRSDAKGMAAAGSGKKLPGNASCEAVLEWLRVRAGAGNVSFLRPGEAVHWGLDDAFRAYVLGPPRDHDDLLRKLNPTPNAGEVYLARGEDVETVMGLAGIHGKHSGDTLVAVQPFTPLYQRAYDGKLGKSKHDVEMKKDSIVKLYRARQRFVRSIDTDWLGSAENLALKIDGDVNNTSLALALELSDKRVLLFPGDAQVGNWLSWGKQTYPESDGGRGRLKIEDILARTILYKVGHHASHNATLSKLGLELMTHVDLCAMVPVVERTAREQVTSRTPDGWGMPHDPLYVQLKKRTANRVIRGDGDVRSEKDKFDKAAFGLSYGPLFKPADPLWVQLTLAL
ncbi:hypothetical protein RPMA_12905 [Tardiphaga alba]|uniref:Uncharacterized protein n=1 Tax=Tardiphaga alba TaxID=340268 RepID=A0ABX8A8R0_9BRAD|nr:hypothetical protein [Tardiphaga alba]QUS39637.1 hypothetical protein RPMA_12905 [Tardiphaga alba]